MYEVNVEVFDDFYVFRDVRARDTVTKMHQMAAMLLHWPWCFTTSLLCGSVRGAIFVPEKGARGSKMFCVFCAVFAIRNMNFETTDNFCRGLQSGQISYPPRQIEANLRAVED